MPTVVYAQHVGGSSCDDVAGLSLPKIKVPIGIAVQSDIDELKLIEDNPDYLIIIAQFSNVWYIPIRLLVTCLT